MSKRSLADEVEIPDTEVEEQKLTLELREALAADEWYATPQWASYEQMLATLRAANAERLTVTELSHEKSQYLRGRINILDFLLELKAKNAQDIKRMNARFEEIESLQEEES